MKHFCTITTYCHLYKVWALNESLLQTQGAYVLHTLVVDSLQTPKAVANVTYYNKLQHPLATDVYAKYSSNTDKLRWSLKPVFLDFLVSQTGRIVYIDNDIAFFNDAGFLFEDLERHPVLLTPHNYPYSPNKDQNWLEANYRVGLYNAGFIGVNADAKKVLNWWAECCLYRCEKSYWRGLFDDQKYLDLVPVIEAKTKVINHKGCNVAGWNIEVCTRTLQEGKTLICNEYPVIFIHYNNYTIRMLKEGNDDLLLPYWKQYFAYLTLHNNTLKESDLYHPMLFIDKLKLSLWRLFNSKK